MTLFPHYTCEICGEEWLIPPLTHTCHRRMDRIATLNLPFDDAKKYICALDNVRLTGTDSIDDRINDLKCLLEDAMGE